ncbi:MAG: hypothetical protein UY21_C0009G0108 [Microgenomates group bacterium GW2011_GWA1_48_10]|nr:MAG: hypothetical protein UY21_C0009G0108 [Microgenomates group bacterium GW2011_GWA1_48_10]
MTPPSMTADAKKKKQFVSADNPVEIFKELGAGIAREASQVPGTILDTAFEQIGLKPQRKPLSGEIELSAGRHQQTQETSVQPDKSASDKLRQLQYVQRQEKEVFSAKQRALEDQINRLLQELAMEVKKLEKQTAELTADVKKVTVETRPTKAGLYHLNFFDAIIIMLKEIRQKVGESRLWLNTAMKKKQQKGYWAMFKKHGLNFAMSDERAIASANG